MKYSSMIPKIQKQKSYRIIDKKIGTESFVFNFAEPLLRTAFPKINAPSELNFFRKIHISEPEHSRILGDLLNPYGTHHMGNVFLRLFFETLGIEFYESDFWTVSVETERFDIRIMTKSHDKIIIIENKSNWADDQPNQLYRYWFHGIYQPQQYRKNTGLQVWSRIFYLSPNDCKQPSLQTLQRPADFSSDLPVQIPKEVEPITIFFNVHIVKWLSKCMESAKDNPELYYFIKQYFDFWR